MSYFAAVSALSVLSPVQADIVAAATRPERKSARNLVMASPFADRS